MITIFVGTVLGLEADIPGFTPRRTKAIIPAACSIFILKPRMRSCYLDARAEVPVAEVHAREALASM